MLIHLPKERRKEARNACRALRDFSEKKLEKACRRCSDENTNRCPKVSANQEPGTVVALTRLSKNPEQVVAATN